MKKNKTWVYIFAALFWISAFVFVYQYNRYKELVKQIQEVSETARSSGSNSAKQESDYSELYAETLETTFFKVLAVFGMGISVLAFAGMIFRKEVKRDQALPVQLIDEIGK